MSEQTPDLDPEDEGEAGFTDLTAAQVAALADQVAAEQGEPEVTDVEPESLSEDDLLVEGEGGVS
jgi:hypothetical protein